MAIQAQLADGRILEFPDGTDPAVIQATVKRMIGEQPVETAGIGEAAVGGAKRYLSRGLTALESLIGDTGEAARAGVARQQEITERPGASLEAVKQAYEQRGLLPAAGEVLSQIPAALAEQGVNIGATLTGSRLGAMAGTAVAPGIGTAVGAIAGALAPNLLQLFAENVERQAEEGKDVSAGRALLAATPGAALETAGGLIPFGKFLIPKVLGQEAGSQVQKLFSRGQIKAAETLANETIAKSVAKGIPLGAGVEGATEAAQAMLNRWQAGLPLFNEEAFQEYGENAYGGALVGGSISGASRPLSRGAAAEEAEALRSEEATRDRLEAQRKAEATRAQFEGERKPLALPAPPERAIPAKVPMELENASLADESLVKFKPAELTPEVRKYVADSRADKNLPKLKSYTIEDLQDAMPGIDPEGERAVLNSILASKTGFDRFISEGIKPTSALVLEEAANKNIDTQSQGFNDFLKRTTGQSDLAQMNPVELYTAYSSLQKMPRMAGEGTQSLPTGSAASRFTEQQYDTALDFVRMTLRDLKTDRLNVGEVVKEIKDATGLETDKDAETLLNTALRNGELEQKERKVYRVLNKDTGELSLPIDKEAVAIRRANQMKNGTVQTEQFYEVGLPNIVTARKDMPEGYAMYLEDVADKDVPEGYEIVQEGKTRPLATQTTEEAAQKQIARIQKRNERRTKNLNKKIEGQQGRIAKAQAVVDDLAARGMGDTSQAKVAQTKLEAETRDANAQIDNFQKEIDEISQPISLRPTRKKVKTTRSRIILRKGDKDIGFFPNKEAATQAMFANMSNAELDAFEDQMNQQEAAGRPRPATAAKAARERASRRKPGIEVRTAEKAAPAETPQQRDERLKRATERFAALGIDSRDRQDVLKGLRDKLKPIMDKLGLGQVSLNVVSGLENGAGGKYDAAKRTISIALDEENPVQTLRHEVIHALKNLGFFTKSQWAALERKARSEWIDKYLKNTMVSIDGNVMTRYNAYKNVLKLSDTDIMEEAIADAFGDFDTNKAPPGMMAAILKRLKAFFEALGNALRGSGFQSAEQIFTKAELGELASGKPEDSLKTKASLRNTTKGLLNPKIEPKYEKIIYDVVEEMGLTPEEFASTSLIHQTGKPGVDQFESDKIGGLADVVQFLQDKRRNSGLPLLNIDNPADRKIIAKLMATEAMAAIRSGGANLEWYDSVINKTLSIAALKYPELDSDLNARMVFRIATAITSQGLNVEDNLKFAMKVYDQFRINGRFPEIGQGEDQGAMINNFKLANYLLDDMGANLMRQFLETEFTAQELRSAGLDIAGELGDEKVLGSAVFGPKIGFGFYSNLNGNFEPVTMDMWFMRTIGRLTGNLKAFRQDLYNSQLTKFRAALDEKGENGIFANQFDKDEIARAKTDDSAAEALVRKVKSAHERDFKNNRQAYDDGTREKSKLVAASETLIKSLDKPKDAPANGSERRNLRDIVRQMVDIVEEKYGKRVPPASLQAVIWYPEQELYKSMGVKLRVTSQNYAGAIEKLLKGEGYGESSISAASKRGSRIAQQLAKSAVAKGAKEAGGEPIRIGPLQTEEKEAFIERGRKRVVLGAEREAPRRKRVIFEVAPDPNNQELTNTWRGLPNDARIAISENIANKIIKRSLDRFGVKGYIDTQVGSYLDDTNPSFALYLDSGDSVSIAKFLGYVLSQDSMMVVSPKAGAGLEKTGAVRINVGDVSPKEIDSIYQRLREIKVDGEQPVGGQSYMNGHMVVLNYSDVPTNQLASLINRKLDNDYEVIVEDVYTSFPEKKDYDYADPSSDPKGNAGVLRQASRDFRSEATRLLQEELESIRPKISAKTGKLKPGEKLSLRTYFESANEAENAVEAAGIPDTLEFALFYGASSLRTNDNTPIPMYHGSSAVIDVFRDNEPIFVSPNARFAEDFAVVRADEAGVTPKIYPVWVRTETTFDYGNPEHRADVIAEAISNLRKPDEPVKERPVYLEHTKKWWSIEHIDRELSDGRWSTIEDPTIQRAMRQLGYDGFIVREAGQDNLAVFSPNQLKSITGNEGQFSLGDPDIKYSLGYRRGSLNYAADTTLGKIAGGRSTGHFGTGVYFLGKPMRTTGEDIEAVLANAFYGDSPENAVDLNQFKLLKATTNIQAENLHDGLKKVNQLADAQSDGDAFKVSDINDENNVRDNKLNLQRAIDEIQRGVNQKHTKEEIEKAIRDALAEVRPIYKKYVFERDYVDSASTRVIKKLGYEGVDVREASRFDNTKYGSVVYAETLAPFAAKFSLGKKMTGMPQIDKSIDDAVNKKIASRSAATMGEKITQAMTPKTVSVIRQQLLNRYQGISDVVKRLQQKRAAETGMDVPMIGEENAENLALLSDLGSGVVASAFGIKGRPGGHVVYRNGAITVDNTKKGLGEIFAPLAQYKDPNVFRYYQYWAGAKRGIRLMGEGREKLFDQSDVARAKELEAKFPEFVQVQKDFVEFNNSLVDTMVKSGVISKEQGNAWVQHADYVPFYRQMENGETTIGPNVFQSMSTVKQPKKLKGGEGQLGDFFESVVRNTKAAVESSLKNNAARAALKAAVELGEAAKLTGTDANLTGPNIVRYFENGQRVAYEAKDSLFVASMSSLHMADIPFLGIISKPADLLRNLVTKDPGFMMANLLRDSMSAWVTSGEKMTPIAGSVASFAKALANKNPTVQALLNAGVIGGYEFSANVMDSGRQFERDLERKAGKGSKALRVASGVWDALEKGTTASDAATRALVYDRVLAETGNEVEALAKSLEVMNFNRKGANAAVRILTSAVPFLNARMQGLDLFYRVGISPSLSKPLTGAAATAAQRARQKTFFIRGATIMALSAMYYVAVAGTDEYEDQEQETRDNNWIIGGAKIPIPFEVGVLFKVVPERIMALTFGSDTGQDFQKSMQRAIVSTFAFNPIPQTFKPMVEVAANYSFFTGRPIIGQGMQDVAPEFQVSPGTTRGAEALGKTLGVSPIKIDHLYKGYTGTMGMYLADVVDSVLDLFGDSPKPSRRFEQLPVIKRFVADPESRGKLTQFYELKRSVDVFVRTSNMLEKSMKPEDWEKYITENMSMFGVASYVRGIEKQLKESREMARMVRNMSASPDEKRDLLTEIGRYEKSLVQNIQEVKKLANQ